MTARVAQNMQNDLVVVQSSLVGNDAFEYSNSLFTNNASAFNTSRNNIPFKADEQLNYLNKLQDSIMSGGAANTSTTNSRVQGPFPGASTRNHASTIT